MTSFHQKFEQCTACKWLNIICAECATCINANNFAKRETKVERKAREKKEQAERLANLKVVPKYKKGQEVFIIEGRIIEKTTIRDLVIYESGSYTYKLKGRINHWEERYIYETIEDALERRIELIKESFTDEVEYVKRVADQYNVKTLKDGNPLSIELKISDK